MYLGILLFGDRDIPPLELSTVKVVHIQEDLWGATQNDNMIWILQTGYCLMYVSKHRKGIWIPTKISWNYGTSPSYFLTDSLTNTETIFKNSWTFNNLHWIVAIPYTVYGILNLHYLVFAFSLSFSKQCNKMLIKTHICRWGRKLKIFLQFQWLINFCMSLGKLCLQTY